MRRRRLLDATARRSARRATCDCSRSSACRGSSSRPPPAASAISRRLRDRGTLVVLLDRRSRDGELCSVSVDHARGGELAARHLFELGHRRIAFINGPLHLSQCAERRRGMRRAARQAGFDADESIIEYTIDPITAFEQAESAVDEFLELPDRPTAVVCVNDQVAFTVLRALAERRVRVPRDVSVVGYDDVEFAAMLSPALTSIRQPKYELGRAAARAADRRDRRPAPSPRRHPLRARADRSASRRPRARKLNRYSPRGRTDDSSAAHDPRQPLPRLAAWPYPRPSRRGEPRDRRAAPLRDGRARCRAGRRGLRRDRRRTPTTSSTSPRHASATPAACHVADSTAGGARPTTARERGQAARARRPYPIAGFTHYVEDRNDGWLRSDEAEEVFALAAERRLIVSLGAALRGRGSAAARRPPSDVPVLCHTSAASGGRGRFGGLAEVMASAAVPNIYLKVAGLHDTSAAGWDYPWPDVSRCSGASSTPTGRRGSAGARIFPPRRGTPPSASRSRPYEATVRSSARTTCAGPRRLGCSTLPERLTLSARSRRTTSGVSSASGSRPSKWRRHSSTISEKKRRRLSSVTPAMCGERNTFGRSRKGESSGSGSGSKTSRQAMTSPRCRRSRSAANR